MAEPRPDGTASEWAGRRVAVIGAGRSGQAAARVLTARGALAVVFDSQRLEHSPRLARAAESLAASGIELRAGWSGVVPTSEFDLVVTSPGVPKRHPALLGAVEAGLEVWGEIELAYRIAKAPIVAVTGTNGKSTTTVMAWLAARGAGMDPLLCGNLYGSGYQEEPLTEAAARATADRLLVAEVSSFQLEWVREFSPVAAAITNITPDHLNRYESFEEYAATKHRIFEKMGAGSTAVWHSVDPVVRPVVPDEVTIWRFGRPGDAAYADHDALVVGERNGDDERVHLDRAGLPWTEPHNDLNAMAALGIVIGAWRATRPRRPAPIEAMGKGLSEYFGLGYRMQFVGEKGGVRIINNSMCTNPAALIASSRSLIPVQHLLIGGLNKGMDFSPVGEYLSGTLHRAYVFGADGASIAEQMGGGWPVFETMAEAFEAAARDARDGEIIMLAPGLASTDQFDDFVDRGRRFQEMAEEWLRC
ncbi:MAG: UDP-N-acetylmuramoyl-L-alanine--D-glutamate ligase [Fimbriimonadaceae bacterium]